MPKALAVVDVSGPVCCAPLGVTSTDPGVDAEEIAARLRALSDANRVRIVQELSCCAGHRLSTSDVAQLLGVSDATANHHLKRLEAAAIVTPQRDGQRVDYVLHMESLRALGRVLHVSCGCGANCC